MKTPALFLAALALALFSLTPARATHPVHTGHNGHTYHRGFTAYRSFGYGYGYGVPSYGYSYAPSYAPSYSYVPSYYYVLPQPVLVAPAVPVQAPAPVQAPVAVEAPAPLPPPMPQAAAPVYAPPVPVYAPPAPAVCAQELQQGYLAAPTVAYLGTLPAFDRYAYLHRHYGAAFADRHFARHFGRVPAWFRARIGARATPNRAPGAQRRR